MMLGFLKEIFIIPGTKCFGIIYFSEMNNGYVELTVIYTKDGTPLEFHYNQFMD